MAGSLLFNPVFDIRDANGAPISGGTATFYLTGTTTLASVYTDIDLTTPATNPQVADSAGRLSSIYLDPLVAYKMVLKDDDGVTYKTVDPITSPLGASVAPERFGASILKANNAAELAAAGVFCNANGITLDGNGNTYAITGPVATWPRLARNITVNGAAVTTSASYWTGGTARRYLLACVGTDVFAGGYATTAVTGAVAVGDEAIPVAAGGEAAYAVGDLILIFENAQWGGVAGPVRSEYAWVRTTSSGSVGLMGPTLGLYSTSATIRKVPRSRVDQRGVKLIGGGTGLSQAGMAFAHHEHAHIEVEARGCALSNCNVVACAGVSGNGVFEDADLDGWSYGLVISGCNNVNMGPITGRNLRHLISHGTGPSGILNRNVQYVGVSGRDMEDATIDAHTGCSDIKVTGYSHYGRTAGNVSSGDGFIAQSARVTLHNAVIINAKRGGVYVQNQGNGDALKGWVDVQGLKVRGGSATTNGYAFRYDDTNVGAGYAGTSTIRVTGLDTEQARGVYIFADVKDVDRVNIEGGRVVATDATSNSGTTPIAAIHLRCNAGRIKRASVRGLDLKAPVAQSSNRGIMATGVSGQIIDKLHVSACHIEGGKYGIEATYATVMTDAVTYESPATGNTSLLTGGALTAMTYA